MSSSWRSVGEPGLFAEWVRALRGRSGVYAIRDGSDGVVAYVGESHSGRLYETLTRHFQSSSRGYVGPTYPRARAEVRVELCAPGAALELQDEWIARLRPHDNKVVPVYVTTDDDGVPF